jgi:hypothetical protein
MAATAAAGPQVHFRNFDHLVIVEPYTGCLRRLANIGICGEAYKQQMVAHAYRIALSRVDANDFSIYTVVVAHKLGHNF